MKSYSRITRSFIPVTLALLLAGCYPAIREKVQRPQDALVPVRFFPPSFQDDLDLDSLRLAVERNKAYLDRLDPDDLFMYGPHTYTVRQVRESQQTLLDILAQCPDGRRFSQEIRERFRIYRAVGRPGNSNVLFTGYFEPVFDARLEPGAVFRHPIYRRPRDLLKIDLSSFHEKYQGESIVARIQEKSVVPYYSRQEIEEQGALMDRGLEIAWLRDPLDVAFLHIQGSGRLRLSDGQFISVGYEASNGRPYRSIGRYLLDEGLMQREDISMQGIREFLARNPGLRRRVLNHNPAYIFFRVLEDGPLGNINVPVTPGRTVALDSRLFPKGALAFISCKKPVINREGEIVRWVPFSRFVLNQDTGGAIRGAGRADLFWGSGAYAEMAAGHLQHEGQLFVLIQKFN
jgi:membrane-bound lytic murein transglycosylase A